MKAIPPPPWFPACGSAGGGGRGIGPFHLITAASTVRLGHLLRIRCSNHLHGLILFSSRPTEGCLFDNLLRVKDICCQQSYPQRRYSLLQTLADAVSTPCSSCFSFLSGKKFEKENGDKGNPRFRSNDRNFLSGRLWTNVILALNVLVYVAQIATHGRLIMWGAKVNSLIDKGQFWRLVTSSFLHANIGHLLINCYSLNSIGPTVEQLSGPRRFLAIYFTSAIASSLMSYRFCQSPAVGASGAIFGLVGSFAVFVVRHKSIFGGGKQDIQHIARVIALNMVIGLLSRGIDNWGHFGGLMGGAAMSWFLGPAWRYKFKSVDGRSVFVDRAPISYLINNKRLH